MSASADIQAGIIELLGLPGALRVNLPLVQRRPKDLGNEIVAAAELGNGLCAYVYPVLPTKVQDEAPFVFVEEGETRIRILERPARNNTGSNAWQIADDICNALQWQPKVEGTALGKILAHPLQLAPRCIQTVADAETRLIDVIFNATYKLSNARAPIVPFEGEADSVAEGLQAVIKAQLDGTLSTPVPAIIKADHDLETRIKSAGNPAMIEILPPMPAGALQGVPFVFFDQYQVRLKVTEYPPINSGPDAYDITEMVMTALHWQPFSGFLSYPLQLAQHPTEIKDNLDRREIEIRLNAIVGLQPQS